MKSPERLNICPAPWHHGFVHADGTIRPCCVSTDILGDTRAGDSISSVWHSEGYRTLRRQMLQGTLPHGCHKCVIKEDLGVTSKRQYLEEQMARFVPPSSSQWNSDLKEDPPQKFLTLDISLGNLCNLRCRFCGPYNSTKWFTDAAQLRKEDSEYWSSLWGSTPDQRIEQSSADYNRFLQGLSHLRAIEFKGGEPFLMAQHIDFLRALVKGGRAAEIELVYSTNGTVIQEEMLELFPKFKLVHLTVSIDAVGELFKYIRGDHFSLEKDVEPNLNFYDRFDNLTMSIHFTLNAYNALSVMDFFNWYRELQFQNLHGWSIGLVVSPDPLQVGHLPEKLRTLALERIANQEDPNIARIRQVLESPFSSNPERLFQYIQRLDHSRGTSALDVIPEFNGYLP